MSRGGGGGCTSGSQFKKVRKNIFLKDHFLISFGAVLVYNKILKVRNLLVEEEFLTFNILLHYKAVLNLMGNRFLP